TVWFDPRVQDCPHRTWRIGEARLGSRAVLGHGASGREVRWSASQVFERQSIRLAAGDMRLMNLVALVENHPTCRRNKEGQKVLPNGQSWRPQMLLLCYSSKILSEANSLLKLQDPSPGKLFGGFRLRAPPLPFLLSSLIKSRPHPKLPVDQGGENEDSDMDLDDLSSKRKKKMNTISFHQLSPLRNIILPS
ncbi:hypothetical protein B296_00042616, partial [Ensete ventricosum]